ncbi:MAG: GTPase ObgE [Oligoflexia bacterium]|nr:GTPase ObgE [Oligoflexia bacterium]
MRFIDEAIIRVSGGHGGPGCVSFRRETFAPRGGPDGGDGGDGGSVSFQATHQLGTLQDFRFKRVYDAPAGMHGSGSNKAGRDGEDIVIPVPVGTVIRDAASGELLVDFVKDGQTWVACKGGRGGKGNAHFVSSTHQAPKFAQPGEVGEARELKLELKLLADVGIIGFPNAGKSTLISRISHARPKIADYPFTTLTPNLGVVQMPDLKTFVVADIPGLVEGAHRGLGLGHKFLKHIERTGLFLHVLDGTKLLEDATRPDADLDETIEHLIERYQIIRRELGLFNEKLLHKPEILVINKVDLLESDPQLVEKARLALRNRIASIRGDHPHGQEPFVISAVSGKGIQELLFAVHAEIQEHRSGARRDVRVRLPDDEDIRS